MKLKVLILVFCVARLHAQLNPPGLRCLEVLPGGDVKLTWLSPNNSGGQFFAYEIYTSSLATGPFTLVATVPTITTNTFTHSGAQASLLSRYYYMVTKSGITGTVSSVNSDTLRSIRLNIYTSGSSLGLTLSYNPIHEPKIQSSQPTFTISKEFPTGTWSVFKVTALNTYPDTLSLGSCTANINYRISLGDAGGCISQSNILGGTYGDSKQPFEPVIDSISVLPDGKTIITWHIPRDPDIARYWVQYLSPAGKHDSLSTVWGRDSTSFIYTNTTATTGPVSLYIGAVDSCGKSSTFNYSITTMFLKATYNQCAYTTQLNWNEYLQLPKGILEYRIYYSVNGEAFAYIGSTTQTSFTHKNANAAKNLCYFVRVVNKDKSITASSNRACFYSRQVDIPQFVYISSAGVRNHSGTVVDLLVDPTIHFNGIEVLRSEDGIKFLPITFLSYNKTRNYTFEDDKAETSRKSYYYKAIVKDSCDNARFESNVARTIYLQVRESKNNEFERQLDWSPYEGFAAGIKNYTIYRVINDVPTKLQLAGTPSLVTSFTDLIEEEASRGSRVEYYVSATENGGNQYNVIGKSNSNPVSVYMEGLLFVPNAFAPEGHNRQWLPVTHFIDKSEYHVTVFDRWGHAVFDTRNDSEAWSGDNNPAGVYIYLIAYKNSLGEYEEKKGIVTLIR